MTEQLHLDTNVLVWLYAGVHDRFPPPLRTRLGTAALSYSPMARLELSHLHEIGKIADEPPRILAELTASIGLTEDTQSFGRVVDLAGEQTSLGTPSTG